ncbi:phosphotransferase enzyme family [Fusarium coicis]|nr:phosphotransferase enzyme family [Fusarium coicis]
MARYIKSKTKIPLPDIHAHGQNEKLVRDGSTTQAFLILDFVAGPALDLQALSDDTLPRRKHFYAQLIEVLAQLRMLEFTKSGSLMPGHEAVPVVDNVLSIPLNEFQVASNQTRCLSMAHSVREFALNQLNLMTEEYRLPRSELSRETVEMEIFALNHLNELTQGLPDDPNCFVLSHPDLRPANIIVDDDLNITSILDWEWTYTVPRQFFMPPSWITLHNLIKSAELGHSESFLEFREVLEEMAKSSSLYRLLANEWGPDFPNKLLLPLSEILQHHSELLGIYYKFIFPQYFPKRRQEVVAEFFRSSRSRSSEVQGRMEDSNRCIQYLKDKRLHIPDEQIREEREWIERARQLDKKLGIA